MKPGIKKPGVKLEEMLKVMHEHEPHCEAHGNHLHYLDVGASQDPGCSGYRLVSDECDCVIDLFAFVESHMPGSIVDRSNPSPKPGHHEVDATTAIDGDKLIIEGRATHGDKS